MWKRQSGRWNGQKGRGLWGGEGIFARFFLLVSGCKTLLAEIFVREQLF